jgi:hypothetical protein
LKQSKTSYLKSIRTHQNNVRKANKSFEISRHLYTFVSTYTEINYDKSETKQQIAQPKDHLKSRIILEVIRPRIKFQSPKLVLYKTFKYIFIRAVSKRSVETRVDYKQDSRKMRMIFSRKKSVRLKTVLFFFVLKFERRNFCTFELKASIKFRVYKNASILQVKSELKKLRK